MSESTMAFIAIMTLMICVSGCSMWSSWCKHRNDIARIHAERDKNIEFYRNCTRLVELSAAQFVGREE